MTYRTFIYFRELASSVGQLLNGAQMVNKDNSDLERMAKEARTF